MNNLKKRIFSSIVYVIVLVGSIAFGEISCALFFMLIILFSQTEFYNFFKSTDIQPQKILGILAGMVLFLGLILMELSHLSNPFYALILVLIFSLFIVEIYRKSQQPLSNIGITLLGILYIALPFSLLYQIAYFNGSYFGAEFHYETLLGYFFILWANDTGAYFIGSKFGKNHLFPSVSPKKTWEGLVGGVLVGLITGIINSQLFPQLNLSIWLFISMIVVVFGTLGDLVESMFKRSVNRKDSGNLIPGHGGALDRFDGILISAPMVYCFLHFFIWIK